MQKKLNSNNRPAVPHQQKPIYYQNQRPSIPKKSNGIGSFRTLIMTLIGLDSALDITEFLNESDGGTDDDDFFD